jgi:small-conductance mechanosensitive channel
MSHFYPFRKPLKVGDIVQIKEYMGVREIETLVETFQGKTVIIPNKEVFQTQLKIIPFYVKTF